MRGEVLERIEAPAELCHVDTVEDLHGLPDDYLNTYVSRVYAVTPAQVQQMASKYIQSDKALIVVVGDKKVIAEQVAPY